MMYTPTPATRRPRPPRSLSRQRTPLISPAESSSIEKEHRNIHSSADITPETARGMAGKSAETPLSTYIRQRTEDARSNLARISASPADVSIALDPEPSSSFPPQMDTSGIASSSMSGSRKNSGPIGLGLSGPVKLSSSGSNDAIAETSPPPPYGHMTLSPLGPSQPDSPSNLATANRSRTPPRQDSGFPSRRASSSLPLNVQDPATQEALTRVTPDTRALAETRADHGGSEEELSDGEVRRRLKDVKQQLQQREDELIIAAKVADRALRSHEQVVAILPHQMKARMPSHLVNLHSDILDPSSSLQHFRSLSGSGSPYTVHLRQFSSSSNTHALSPIESYPPTASTFQVDRFQTVSPQSPEHGLDSPFRIISPEQRMHGSHRAYPSVRLTETSFAMPHHRQRSRPSIFGSHSFTSTRAPSPKYARMSALQAEAEDRIIALEQALMEARENEEDQRKLASRLRKDMEKMQRELLRADEQRAEEELVMLKASVIGGLGGRKRATSAKEGTAIDDARSRRSSQDSQEDQERLGWGSTAFPEFPPAGPSRSTSQGRYLQTQTIGDIARDGSYIEQPLGQVMIANLRDELNDADDSDSSIEARPATTQLAVQTVPVDEMDSISSTSQEDGPERDNRSESRSLTRKSGQNLSVSHAKEQALPKSSSDTQFLPPPKPTKHQSDVVKPPTPRVTIESPSMSFGTDGPSRQRKREGSSSQESGKSIRRSPWPARRAPDAEVSPDIRRTLDFFSSESQACSRSPSMSPALASVSSRMASMRAYMTHNLSNGPMEMGRTLGSELGSEFGEDWERDIRSLDETRLNYTNQGPASPSPPSRSARTFLLPQRVAAHYNHEISHDDADNDDDASLFSPMSQPPFPLPANVSAALSSLAMALAPDNMFNHSLDSIQPILPRGSLREPGLDYAAYEMLNEACKAREIKWADEERSAEPLSSSTQGSGDVHTAAAPTSEVGLLPLRESIKKWGKNKDPWESAEYSDELSVSDHVDPLPATKGVKAFQNRPGLSVISAGKRPVSYVDHVSGDTPRKYALAHRRTNSAAVVPQHKTQRTTSTSDEKPPMSKGKGRASDYPRGQEKQFRPDQTLTRRGLRSLQTSLSVSETATASPDIPSTRPVSTSASSPASNASSQISKRDSKTVRFAAQVSSSLEPSTIPARLVHDVFCWLGILLEYFEWSLVLIIRICIDIRSGPGGMGGLRRKQRAKRYYL
ncbi:hypothetical protein IAT40_005340 [Kwoniella sp. CBS 6097]